MATRPEMSRKNVAGPSASITAYSRLAVNALFQRDPAWLFETSRDLFAVKRGRKVVVKSRSRVGLYHTVDLEKGTCTCEGFRYRGRCWHLEAAQYAEAVQ